MKNGRTVAALRIAVLLVILGGLLAVPYTRRHVFTSGALGGFAAFYCGGQTIREGYDPYLAEPLRTCEQRLSSYTYDAVGVVEPAPFPPVVLTAFAALAALPFTWAFGLYVAVAVGAIAFATWSLQRMTGLSGVFIGASLAIGALYHNVQFGEIPPMVIGILCAAALLLERRHDRSAAIVASLSLIEPHVTAPVLLALFIGSKRSRAAIIVVGIAAMALSAVLVHPALTVEYFVRVLPAHAASEITASDQYSVTWLAHRLGAGDVLAVRLGSASYAVMALAGILLGLQLAKRYARPAFLVFVPAAFAVIGGPFIHDIQLPLALPAALLLLSVTRGRERVFALAAVMLLALTWYDDFGAVLAMAALAVLAWTSPLTPAVLPRRIAFTAAICSAYGVAIVTSHGLSTDIQTALPRHPDVTGSPDDLASDVWGRYVRATAYGWPSLKTRAERIPLWTALLLLVYTAFQAARAAPAKRTSQDIARLDHDDDAGVSRP